jgi:hypothetical protein
MLKVLDFKNPSACFRHGGGTGAHAPLDIYNKTQQKLIRVRGRTKTFLKN